MIFRPSRLSLLLLAVVAFTTTTTTITVVKATIVSESSNRLPMSLSTVIADLEAEGMTALSTACLITSHSVTSRQKQQVVQRMLGSDVDETKTLGDAKVVATSDGLALVQPQALEEVVQCCVACQGLVVFVPSACDLARGEGLMDALAPAMERLQQWSAMPLPHQPCLVVVYEETTGKATTQAKLEAAAASLNTNLDDVFSGGVLYLTAEQVAAHLVQTERTSTPEDAMALVARVVAEDSSLLSLSGESVTSA